MANQTRHFHVTFSDSQGHSHSFTYMESLFKYHFLYKQSLQLCSLYKNSFLPRCLFKFAWFTKVCIILCMFYMCVLHLCCLLFHQFQCIAHVCWVLIKIYLLTYLELTRIQPTESVAVTLWRLSLAHLHVTATDWQQSFGLAMTVKKDMQQTISCPSV